MEMDGFGEKSYENLIASIRTAAKTTLPRVIYGLGITGIGLANAKMLCKAFSFDFEAMRQADAETLTQIDGIGRVLAEAWIQYFGSEENNQKADRLLKELEIEQPEIAEGTAVLDGMIFVITGSVHHFANRKALQEVIESKGGKVTGSVTARTTYLINNDTTSNSSKNKKARELGISIISEEEFLNMAKIVTGEE